MKKKTKKYLKYEFAKKSLKETLVFIKTKKDIITYDIDKLITKYFNYKKMNYVILGDNEINIYQNKKRDSKEEYKEYYVKSLLLDFLENLERSIRYEEDYYS